MVDAHSDGDERRRAHRSNLFLAASIESGGASGPVRIRNLSETGALLEGPAFPAVGTTLALKRQEVEVAAEVVWVAGGRCGIRFDGNVSVPEWIAGKRAVPTFGQARVDAIQAAVRSGAELGELERKEEGDAPPSTGLDERLAQEIAYVQRLLEQASADLIGDPAVVQRHGRVLQNFDIADQILGHLARVVTAPDREAAIRSIGMQELRARLLRRSS